MVHLISQHSCRAWQFILPSPRGSPPSYSVEPITANTRATAPDMPPSSAGTNHQGGGVSFLSMITLPLNNRSEEHTSELQSLMRISYAVFCLKKKTQITT